MKNNKIDQFFQHVELNFINLKMAIALIFWKNQFQPLTREEIYEKIEKDKEIISKLCKPKGERYTNISSSIKYNLAKDHNFKRIDSLDEHCEKENSKYIIKKDKVIEYFKEQLNKMNSTKVIKLSEDEEGNENINTENYNGININFNLKKKSSQQLLSKKRKKSPFKSTQDSIHKYNHEENDISKRKKKINQEEKVYKNRNNNIDESEYDALLKKILNESGILDMCSEFENNFLFENENEISYLISKLNCLGILSIGELKYTLLRFKEDLTEKVGKLLNYYKETENLENEKNKEEINKMIQDIFIFIKVRNTIIKSIISTKIVLLDQIISDIKSIEERILSIKNQNNQRKDILIKYNKVDFYNEAINRFKSQIINCIKDMNNKYNIHRGQESINNRSKSYKYQSQKFQYSKSVQSEKKIDNIKKISQSKRENLLSMTNRNKCPSSYKSYLNRGKTGLNTFSKFNIKGSLINKESKNRKTSTKVNSFNNKNNSRNKKNFENKGAKSVCKHDCLIINKIEENNNISNNNELNINNN